MTQDAMRVAFEEYVSKFSHSIGVRAPDFDWNENLKLYYDAPLRSAFHYWQAAHQSREAEVMRLREALEQISDSHAGVDSEEAHGFCVETARQALTPAGSVASQLDSSYATSAKESDDESR